MRPDNQGHFLPGDDSAVFPIMPNVLLRMQFYANTVAYEILENAVLGAIMHFTDDWQRIRGVPRLHYISWVFPTLAQNMPHARRLVMRYNLATLRDGAINSQIIELCLRKIWHQIHTRRNLHAFNANIVLSDHPNLPDIYFKLVPAATT